MKNKAPKQPRVLRLADEIMKPNCTLSTREDAAMALRKLYELNQSLYVQMNESWTEQFHARQKMQGSLKILGKAISKSRDLL